MLINAPNRLSRQAKDIKKYDDNLTEIQDRELPWKNGLWKYQSLYEPSIVPSMRLLTPFEGSTVESVTDHKNLFVKREDETLLGSHKIRSMIYRFSLLLQKWKNERHSRSGATVKGAVLSSSGNAALAAAHCAAAIPDIPLILFISPDTNQQKLQEIIQRVNNVENIQLFITKRAMRLANYVEAKYKYENLRPSRDPLASVGFESIGYELIEQLPQLDKIVSFCTSGASLMGIYHAYVKRGGEQGEIPQMYGVVAPDYQKNLGVKNIKVQVENKVSQTGGAIVGVKEKQIRKSLQELHNQKKKVSWEAAAAYEVGRQLALQDPSEVVAVIMTGKFFSSTADLNGDILSQWPEVSSFTEVDATMKVFEERAYAKNN